MSDIEQYWNYEYCHNCYRNQRTAWSVTNELWNRVIGKNKILCLECFLGEADNKKIEIKKSDFIFLGFIGKNIKGCIIKERSFINE